MRWRFPYAHVWCVLISIPSNTFLIFHIVQRILARLREQTYAATLRHEVEILECGKGDALSRLSVDSTIVGEP